MTDERAPTELDVAMRQLAELVTQARKVVDAIFGDEGGRMIAGHGGLLSRSTIIEAYRLRHLIEAIGG